MCYSCSHINFCSICLSQNSIEVLFFPPKISVMVRRKRKPTTWLIGLETCSFIFTKMLYKTKGNNDFCRDCTREYPGGTRVFYYFWNEIAVKKGHFSIHESSVFFFFFHPALKVVIQYLSSVYDKHMIDIKCSSACLSFNSHKYCFSSFCSVKSCSVFYAA